MAAVLPQCSDITRKRGVYYFRKRLPRPQRGEIALSLRTRHYREAEYLGEMLTQVWDRAAKNEMLDQEKLRAVLAREHERLLKQSHDRVVSTPYGETAFAPQFAGEPEEAHEADLEATDAFITRLQADFARRDLRAVETVVRRIMATNDIPANDFQRFGLMWLKVSP